MNQRSTSGEPIPASALNRRGFLRVAGVAAAALAGCQRRAVEHALPYLTAPEEIAPGVPVHYASTCAACPAACGLLVTVLDGRPIKLEGNPDDPRARGGLCAVGQADLRALYDAGRLRAPRIGQQDTTWAALDGHLRRALGEQQAAGRGVFVLSHSLTSPTGREVIRDFLRPYGGGHVELDPLSASAALDVQELMTGHAALPSLDLARAGLLVSLGADLLATGEDPVAHARAWAERRGGARALRPFRHVHVEGSLSLTGAAADERWQVTASGERLVSLWLLRLVAEATQHPDARAVAELLRSLPDPPIAPAQVQALAAALVRLPGESLMVSGADDPLEQAAVLLANRFLGNEGSTVHPDRPSFVRRGRDGDLRKLLDAIAAGQVGALVVLDCDPVDDLPEGESLAKALEAMPLSVAITSRPTATARACRVVAAAHHTLERWGDFAPELGQLTLAQPSLSPLFGTRDPFECLLRWSGAKVTDYREHLRAAWKANVLPPAAQGTDPDEPWRSAVSRGRAPEGARAPALPEPPRTVTPPAAALAQLLAPAGDLRPAAPSLEVELIEEVAMRQGQRASVPWLRELPDPLTRVAWQPCVRLAPSRARELGVTDGDIMEITAGNARLELPVRVLPGQHPDVAAVPVGYGGLDAADGSPQRNAYRLAQWTGGVRRRRGLPATLRRLPGHVALPLMQIALATEGRPIVHQVHAPNARADVPTVHESLWPERPSSGPRWEMTIDLDRCTGCSACVVACQAENNIPVVGPEEMRRQRDMHWLRIDRYFAGSPEAPDVLFQPMLCVHCGHAPCETVCPVAATAHSHDGLNQQAYSRCIGTRYCENNCPYKVRRFNWFDHPFTEPIERMVLNPNVVVRARGVMEKCTFCVQRIQTARIAARIEGRAGPLPVETACQQSCPTRAIHFGDGTDPGGAIAEQKAAPRAFQVLAELGTRPAVTYLARIRPVRDGEKT